MTLRIFVDGKPRPQGSKSISKTGRMYDAAKGLHPWRTQVAGHVFLVAEGRGWEKNREPMVVSLDFRFQRPNNPTYSFPPKNDSDKLTRAILDAITQAGNVWVDDDQAVILHVVKRYALPSEAEGVFIEIREKP